MVVITLVLKNNGETIFLDQAIPQVHFMKLISCSLYNSWHTLKKLCFARMGVIPDIKEFSEIHSGHYTLEGLSKMINGLFPSSSVTHLKTKIYAPEALLQIKVESSEKFSFGQDLNNLLGIDGVLEEITNVKSLSYPSSYFIHCDLIDRDFNFVNSNKSDLLAKIDVKGRPYEKVRYDSSASQPIRDCSTSSHVNSITVSVKDVNGELFDFKGMPLEFELELN